MEQIWSFRLQDFSLQSISLNDSLLPREWINRRIAVKLIFLSNGFSFATIIPHFPWLQRKLEIGDALTGFALLFPAIGAVSMMLLTGNLIQRFGSRRLILAGGILMQCCLPLILLMPTLALLAPVLLLIGGASGMMDVAMNAQAARIEHAYQRPIMSSFHAVWSLGTLLGGGLTTLLLGLDWTPLEHAGMIAVLLFLLVIVCGPWLIATEEATAEKAPLVSIPRGPVLVRLERDLCPKPAGSVPEPGGCGFYRIRADNDRRTLHRGQAGSTLGTGTNAALCMRVWGGGASDRTFLRHA